MMRNLIVILAVFVLAGCGSQDSAKDKGPMVPQQQKAASAQPSNNELKSKQLVQDGIRNLNSGEVAEAIQNFNNAILTNPGESEAYLVLGQTLMRIEQYDQAVNVFTALTRVEPENGTAFYLLAMANGLDGDKEAAKENAQQSIEIFQNQKDEESFLRSVALLQGLYASENSETDVSSNISNTK